MGTTAKVIAIVVIIAGLGAGGYAAFHGSGSNAANPNANTSPTPSTSNDQAGSDTSATQVAATITFTGSGFTPSVTTVKTGDTVQVVNNSSQTLDFDSDPHPVHTDEPELNVGTIEPGKSKTFTVTHPGHWGFHDHLNPGLTGTLDVQ